MQSKGKKTDIFQSTEFRVFIQEYVQKDTFQLALSPDFKQDIRKKAYLQQLRIYQKALYKLPLFVEKFCLFTGKSYEQSSSEATALFKSGIFRCDKLLDISGGLGVDDWAFANAGATVDSVDPDTELNEFATYNFELLGVAHRITRYSTTAERFLESNSRYFDGIYCDADRRTSGTRSIDLSDALPDVVKLMPVLFSFTDKVLIKASPMADITACCRQLKHVEKVYVVEWNAEVKELLFLLTKDFIGQHITEAVSIDLTGRKLHSLSTSASPHDPIENETTTEYSYFVEPSPAIIKAGLVDSLASTCRLQKVGKTSAYLLGVNCPDNFWGRVFRVKKRMRFQATEFSRYLISLGITQANVAKRDFPLNVVELRKKFKLKDGGDDYLFFTTNSSGEKEVYHCLRFGKTALQGQHF